MLQLTEGDLHNATLYTLNWFERKNPHYQTLERRPLLKFMMKNKMTFAASKAHIVKNISGDRNDDIQLVQGRNRVDYNTDTSGRQAFYPFAFLHKGFTLSYDALQKNGISVVANAPGQRTTKKHSKADLAMLANVMDIELHQLYEGFDAAIHKILWQDGTEQPGFPLGVTSMVVDNPNSAVTVGGIDQERNKWWRNRAKLNVQAGTTSGNTNLAQTLEFEMRQAMRYTRGIDTNIKIFAGATAIDALEREIRANGNYTETGWAGSNTEVGIKGITFKGNMVMYDPMLDDLGWSNRIYLLDLKAIRMECMEGEEAKMHYPERPHDEYALYRSKTTVFGVTCVQRNSSVVITVNAATNVV